MGKGEPTPPNTPSEHPQRVIQTHNRVGMTLLPKGLRVFCNLITELHILEVEPFQLFDTRPCDFCEGVDIHLSPYSS